jgi:alpha-galactosidase
MIDCKCPLYSPAAYREAGVQITGAGNAGWTLRFGGHRYDLEFAGGALRNTYFGPDFAGAVEAVPDHRQNADQLRLTRPEAAVYLGRNRDRVFWRAVSAERSAGRLRLTLEAEAIRAELDFYLDDATGTLRRCTRLTATAATDVELSGALSLSLTIGEPVRRATWLSGRWANETQVRSIVPDGTPLLLESRSGKTGFEYQPYLALETASGTTVIELMWSGNWHLNCRTRDADCLVAGGLPEAGFRHVLAAGETLELPEALVTRVAGDLDLATRRLHDARRKLQAGEPGPVPVQFNSWYPYPGDPAVGDMKRLAETAQGLGCEVFVLAGGWYVNEADPAGDDPWQATGDWLVNPRLFPNGLEELADHCRRIGIRFGIWFEPEGIGHSSALRRRHPEWHHWIDGRPPDPAGRAILNLGVPEARAHVRDAMLGIVRRTGATWIKWDFNADLVSGGWAGGTPAALRQKDPIVAHYQGLYQLQEELRAGAPGLVLEMCASGGGRFDGRILRHADTQWMSDQSDPLRNLAIHFGSQRAHPAKFCNDWLIAWPAAAHQPHGGSEPDRRGDFLFRLRVAMLGSFGVSARLQDWTAAEIAACRAHIGWYRQYARPVIESGDQYLLTEAPPLDGNGDWAAVWYAAKDGSGGVGTLFRLNGADARRDFRLPGLDPDAAYRLIEYGGEARELRGATLATGVPFTIALPYRSIAFRVERV